MLFGNKKRRVVMGEKKKDEFVFFFVCLFKYRKKQMTLQFWNILDFETFTDIPRPLCFNLIFPPSCSP